jgi:hypothetical protein
LGKKVASSEKQLNKKQAKIDDLKSDIVLEKENRKELAKSM